MADNKVVVIDWVDSSAGDIRADVYRTYLLYSQLSIELADLYLRLYCEKSGLLRSEIFNGRQSLLAQDYLKLSHQRIRNDLWKL